MYSLATELLCPDMGDSEVPDDLLDSPPVRFLIGEALAGRSSITLGELTACHEALGVTRSAHGLPVIADDRAHEPLAPLLQIIQTRPGLRLLTAGPRYEQACQTVEEGVLLAQKLSPGLVSDVLAHVHLFAVLDPETSHGLVSASSRWFPGLVLIDAPTTPMEVAEGLVHEGAHQKFFDFAITRRFFGFEADMAEKFVTSWSKTIWPMEQTVAAFHAYALLHRFALDAGVPGGHCEVGASSLLPVAAGRAAEIGSWLVDHVNYLQEDARTLLKGLLPGAELPARELPPAEAVPPVTGHLRVDRLVRLARRTTPGGRTLAGKAVTPPELYWISPDEGEALQLLNSHADGLGVDDLTNHLASLWAVAPEEARPRVSIGLRALLDSRLIH